MRLVNLTVERFRSINAARQIPIKQVTSLVGPNNEGKSNILRALVIAMNALSIVGGSRPFGRRGISKLIGGRRVQQDVFDAENDLPRNLSQAQKKKGAIITLEFLLTPQEVQEFRNEIGSSLNGTLPITFEFHDQTTSVIISKPGRGHKTLNEKSAKIAAFVSSRIEVQYIPAVRTAQAATDIVNDLVRREISSLERDSRYAQAISDILALQKPILDQLGASLASTMQRFMPNVRGASIFVQTQNLNIAISRSAEIVIDDGTPTPLEFKGDGVQSLAALAIMRHGTSSSLNKRETIIALEEPESHLHPSAIRELKSVIEDISANHQIVMTTHNPIFTQRNDVTQNVIVNKNRAFAAKSVQEVREVLGVRISDNLSGAELVLLVEGEEDKLALTSFLSSDLMLKSSLEQGRLCITPMRGAGNVAYFIKFYNDALCNLHLFLDNDKPGRDAKIAGLGTGLLQDSDINLAVTGGNQESELEDLYSDDVFEAILLQETGLTLTHFNADRRRKWTEKLRTMLRRAGRSYDDPTILAIKIKVAREAALRSIGALQANKRIPVESLMFTLKNKLGALD